MEVVYEEDREGSPVPEWEQEQRREQDEKAASKKRKREAKQNRGASRRQQQIIKKNFNDLMHPRNTYKVKTHDFNVLAKKYASFKQ